MNDFSLFLPHGQTFRQFSETLPLPIAIIVLYLKSDLILKIKLKPKLNWGYSRLSLNNFLVSVYLYLL